MFKKLLSRKHRRTDEKEFSKEVKMASTKTLEMLAGTSLEFGLDVYKTCSQPDKNVFLSPYSIAIALYMTNLGAKGKTNQQIKNTMYHGDRDDREVSDAFKTLIKALDQSAKGNLTFRTANRMYVQNSFSVLENYQKDLENFFGTGVTSVDFVKDGAKACREINQWVEKITNNKINNLIAPSMINALTRVILVNAVYFKGDWLSKFEKTKTVPYPFRTGKQTIEVDMMNQKSKFFYGESERHDCKVLKMPYVGSTYSMVIVLPNTVDGLAKLESTLNAEMLEDLMSNVHKIKVQVSLPKFKLEQDYDLKTVLSAMGITELFSPQSGDLSGVTGTRDLYVSDAIHKAFVEVNEEGSEAAAATAVVMGLRSMPMDDFEFVADHPFLFLIREESTGHVVFIGSLKNPEPSTQKDEL